MWINFYDCTATGFFLLLSISALLSARMTGQVAFEEPFCHNHYFQDVGQKKYQSHTNGAHLPSTFPAFPSL
jgi:hypothetical protein